MEPIPFRSLLMIEGVLSRDGRMMEVGSQVWTCPMTLYAQTSDGHGSEPGPTVIAGRIDAITRQNGGEIWGEGFFTTDEGIYVVAPMVADNTLRGISVDTAPKVVEYRAGTPDQYEPDAPVQQTPEEAANPEPEVSEGEPIHRESIEDVIMVVVEGEIIAATICGKQAMGDAFIELVTPENPIAPDVADAPPAPVAASGVEYRHWRVHGTLTAAAALPVDAPAPDAPEVAPVETPAQPDYSGSAMICLRPPEASELAVDGGLTADELHITLFYLGDAADLGADALAELPNIVSEIAQAIEPGEGRVAGPAAFVNEPDPDEPAQTQTPLVCLIDSDWITDLRSALDDALDASGIDSPTEHGFIPHMTIRYAAAPELLTLPSVDFTFPSVWLVIGEDETEFPCGAAITASALGAAPEEPPVEWFADPAFHGPTPLTVTDDGRVFGHIATWNTCHQGFSGRCVRPPKSRSNYAYFNLGELRTAEGDRIAVGQVTLDTRHADLAATRRQAELHYEHTGNAVADVRAGEDKHGVWIVGAVRPETPSSALRRFRGSKISGDWRAVNGGLELVGALAVNIPGFPVLRPQARVASATGEVTALITGEVEAPLVTDDALIDALAYMAEHGADTIATLAASAHEPAPAPVTIDSILATL